MSKTEIWLPDGAQLVYTIPHETWLWSKQCRHDRSNGGRRSINVRADSREHGCVWEFEIVEYDLKSTMLRIKMFADAWRAFVDLAPFFAALAVGSYESVYDVRILLDSLGAADKTRRPEALGEVS